MYFKTRNKLSATLICGIVISSATTFASAQQATGTTGTQQPAGTTTQPSQPAQLTKEQLAQYTDNPAKLLTDFSSSPEALASAITQLATSGTAGANAATAALQLAASSGNKDVAQAVSKGLGVAVSQLSQTGNVALANSIQSSVAAISSTTSNKEVANALNSSFLRARVVWQLPPWARVERPIPGQQRRARQAREPERVPAEAAERGSPGPQTASARIVPLTEMLQPLRAMPEAERPLAEPALHRCRPARPDF